MADGRTKNLPWLRWLLAFVVVLHMSTALANCLGAEGAGNRHHGTWTSYKQLRERQTFKLRDGIAVRGWRRAPENRGFDVIHLDPAAPPWGVLCGPWKAPASIVEGVLWEVDGWYIRGGAAPGETIAWHAATGDLLAAYGDGPPRRDASAPPTDTTLVQRGLVPTDEHRVAFEEVIDDLRRVRMAQPLCVQIHRGFMRAYAGWLVVALCVWALRRRRDPGIE